MLLILMYIINFFVNNTRICKKRLEVQILMDDNQANVRTGENNNTVWQITLRLIASAIVLAITAFFTPGFHINNIWALGLAAIVLSLIDYLVVKFTRA